MKNIKKKFSKRKLIILLIIIFLIIGLGIFLYYKNQKDLLASIKSHYSKNIIITKNTKIYDKNEKIIGNIKKGTLLTLKKQNNVTVKDKYFQIDNTSYYLYYQDFKPSKKKPIIEIDKNYLVFNSNVKTSKKTELYQNSKLVLTINKELDTPILYIDDKYYYISYLNQIFQIKKEQSNKLVENINTDMKEAEYISVLHYETIYSNESCTDSYCIPLTKLQEHIKYLQEQGYYSITLDEYKNYLNKNIRLKEKAVLLTTSNVNDTLTKWNQENNYKIEVVDQNTGLTFNNTNKKSTKDSNKESIDRYRIKNTTSDDNFHKMVQGENVVEPVIFPKVVNEQSIPVLNYHFFYDSSLGESCNENICLDVKVFRQHLEYLKNNGYKTLKMEEFKQWMYGNIELPEKSVLITVDDGAMGTGTHNGNKLIPLLEEYNMNATLFLISGWWDVNNYRSKNLDIQSHTYDMHQYGSCKKGQLVCASKEEALNDLKKSLTIVDNNNSFCFPFYSYSQVSIEAVKEAGFQLAFIGGSRKAKRSDNKYLIPRYPIHKTHSMDQFIAMVS